MIANGATEITLEDNVKITGTTDMTGHVFIGGILFQSLVTITAVNNGKTFGINELLTGIIQITGTGNTTLSLPTGTLSYAGINNSLSVILNKSFEWSIINIEVFTCALSAATAHTVIGSVILASSTSARFVTSLPAIHVAIP